MPTRIICPNCGARLRLTEELPENSRVACSRCGKSFETHNELNASVPPPAPVKQRSNPAHLIQPSRRIDPRLAGMVGVVGALLLCLILMIARIHSSDSDKPAPTENEPDLIAKADENKPVLPIDPRIEAEKQAREAEQKKQLDFDQLMLRGNGQLAVDHFENAQAAFREAVRLFPDRREAMDQFEKATAMIARKKKEPPEEPKKAGPLALDDKVKSPPVNPEEQKKQLAVKEQLEIGHKALAANQTREALAAFMGVLLLSPDHPEATREIAPLRKGIDILDRGLAALGDKRFGAANKDIDDFFRLFPNDPEGKTARARSATALKSAQQTSQNLCIQAQASKRNRQYQKAVDFFTQAREAYPDGKEAAGWLAETKKEFAAAQKNYQGLLDRADTLSATGKFEEAETAVRTAMTVFPEGKEAAEKLNLVLSEIKQEKQRQQEEEERKQQLRAQRREQERQDRIRLEQIRLEQTRLEQFRLERIRQEQMRQEQKVNPPQPMPRPPLPLPKPPKK